MGALLFFDLGDSTGASERLGDLYPRLLRQFMDEIDQVMLRYREGARLDGTIGQTDCEPGDARMKAFSASRTSR
jgi:class 3 adenylate cyclase